VEKVQKAIASLYHDGKPLHHLPSAANLDPDRSSSTLSSFFVSTVSDFCKLKAEKVQEIFRHRHIVLRGSGSVSEDNFDVKNLEKLGSLELLREIQGVFSSNPQ
jgi:hypothetical protein